VGESSPPEWGDPAEVIAWLSLLSNATFYSTHTVLVGKSPASRSGVLSGTLGVAQLSLAHRPDVRRTPKIVLYDIFEGDDAQVENPI
jgi:hypothetical protein